MTVCKRCGYRNTPDNRKTCNYCGKIFKADEIIQGFENDELVKLLQKYGHEIVKVEKDDVGYYVELDRTTFDKYEDDFSVEINEIKDKTGHVFDAFEIRAGKNVKIWFRKQ